MDDLSDRARLALEEMKWVRELARSLLGDKASADDVAQDAWLIASEKVPTDGRPQKPWLSRVVLNLVRMRARTAKRRLSREAAVADTILPVPTPAELAEQVELQRAVADEVLALTEPYRTTVLLRYVEGLSSVEIALRLQIPNGTVRRRLKTALDEIRRRLNHRADGPSGGWLAALIPFCYGRSSDAAAKGAAGSPLALAAVCVVTVCLSGFALWTIGGRDHERPRTSSTNLTHRNSADERSERALQSVPEWFAQAKVQPRRVAGVVTFEGKPVGDAVVRLGVRVGGAPPLLVGERHTLPDGSFDFGKQPATRYVVSAQASGRAPLSVSTDVADPGEHPDQLELSLAPCTSRIIGTVRDAAGAPVTRARLTTSDLAQAESDDHGAYDLCLPQGGRMRVDAEGYGSLEFPAYVAGESRRDVVLVPEVTIVGQVVDQTDRPVSHAVVKVTPEPTERPYATASQSTISEVDGHFQVAGIAPGKFELTAAADGLATDVPYTLIARSGASSIEPRHIVLSARTHVQGRVVMNGKPVAGARVGLWDHVQPFASSEIPEERAVSQLDGTFAFELAGRGAFNVEAAPFEVESPKLLNVNGTSIDLTVEVSKRPSLRGRVTRHGQPASDAEVDYLGATRLHSRSDRRGEFSFEGVSRGNARVYVVAADGKSFAFRDVSILDTKDTVNFDVELAFGGSVKGRVIDALSRPVAHVYVRLINSSADECGAMTDGNGAFDCVGLMGGDYKVGVYPTAALQRAFVATDPKGFPLVLVPDGSSAIENVELQINYEALSLRGRVVDDTGTPVPDCAVSAVGGDQPSHSLDGPPSLLLPSTVTASDGRFDLTNLAPGRYGLEVHAGDGARAELTGILAGADALEIRVPRSGAIEGELVGFTDPPVVHALMLSSAFGMGHFATVNGDRFSIEGLPAGTFPVEAVAGNQVDAQSVEVRAGETTHVALRARATVKLEGQIHEPGTATPTTGMVCEARPVVAGRVGDLTPMPVSLPSDLAGTFSVIAPVGRVRVSCRSTSGPLAVAGTDVDVLNNMERRLDLVAHRWLTGPPLDPGFALWSTVLPLTVRSIDPDGPATNSGLMVGDEILAVNGTVITGLLPDAASMVLSDPAVGVLNLSVARNNSSLTIEIVPVPLP